MVENLKKITNPEICTPEKNKTFLSWAKSRSSHLASLIFNISLSHTESREDIEKGLFYIFNYIKKYFDGLFEVIVVEQGEKPILSKLELSNILNFKHVFLYNPEEFNRGWGFNVACAHHSKNKVVVLMDTDILPGKNFVNSIIQCHLRYDYVSPYKNIYYTNEEEKERIIRLLKTEFLSVCDEKLKNPVTISGGIFIAKREKFLSLGGFEEYRCYGYEDRAFDTMILTLCPETVLFNQPYVYVHMFHHIRKGQKQKTKLAIEHFKKHYRGPVYDKKIGIHEYIYKNFKFCDVARMVSISQQRVGLVSDPYLYRKPNCKDYINAIPPYKNLLGSTYTGIRENISIDLSCYRNLESTYPSSSKVTSVIKNLLKKKESKPIGNLLNKHFGKRCFIIGNGPSLNKHDLSLLNNEYSFGVNGIFYKTKETGFRPSFFVVEDTSVMKENLDEIIKYVPKEAKFFPHTYKSIHPKSENTYFFNMNRGFYEKKSPNYCVPRFSTDASDVLYCGQSVTFINLQLAFFMGFTEVYLIGMDFDYTIPKEHEKKGDIIKSTTDDPNHFHKDYFGKGKTWKDPKLDRVLSCYKMAKLAYESVGRKIFNATEGGKLDLFDRANYNSLFEKEKS